MAEENYLVKEAETIKPKEKLIYLSELECIKILRMCAQLCNEKDIEKIFIEYFIKNELIPYTKKTEKQLLVEFYGENAEKVYKILRRMEVAINNAIYYKKHVLMPKIQEKHEQKEDDNKKKASEFDENSKMFKYFRNEFLICIKYHRYLANFMMRILNLFYLKNNRLKDSWLIQDQKGMQRTLRYESIYPRENSNDKMSESDDDE